MSLPFQPYWLAAAAPLLLAACGNMPPPSAPPSQRQPLPVLRSYRVEHVVNFSTGDMAGVVSDILRPSGGWSWTRKRPSVRVRLRGGFPVRYGIDFAVAEATFAQTGPVNVTFFVNDHPLETVRYAVPGPQLYEKPVPPEWLKSENIIGAEVDKLWTSPGDGAQLGLILNSIGLTEQ